MIGIIFRNWGMLEEGANQTNATSAAHVDFDSMPEICINGTLSLPNFSTYFQNLTSKAPLKPISPESNFRDSYILIISKRREFCKGASK
jgi:hypothetical protein